VKVPDLDDYQLICANMQISLPNRTWAEYYFGHFADRRVTHYEVYPSDQSDRLMRLKLLRKGDLLKYVNNSGTTTHISIVYSERAEIVGGNARYRIVHAYGENSYTYPDYDPTNPNQNVFSRKVLVTWQNISANPTGYGRIKLWQ